MSKLGENFSIYANFIFLQAKNKFTVRNSYLSASGVNLDLPKFSELSLLGLSVSEGISPGVIEGGFRRSYF